MLVPIYQITQYHVPGDHNLFNNFCNCLCPWYKLFELFSRLYIQLGHGAILPLVKG